MKNNNEIELREGSVADHLVSERFDFGGWLESRVKDAPWWGISAVVHIMFLLVAGTLLMAKQMPEDHIIKFIPLQTDAPKPLEPLELPRPTPEPPKVPSQMPDVKETENTPFDIDAEPSDTPETDDDSPYDSTLGDIEESTSRRVWEIGVGPGNPGKKGPGGHRNRRVIGPPSGTKTPDDSVDSGLRWLALHQNPNGSWGGITFHNQCKGIRCSGPGHSDFDVGLTGLALLAFTGANFTPSSQERIHGIKSGDIVSKAANFLKSIQKENGIYGDNSMLKFMYNQAIASYAMADLYCLMKDRGEPSHKYFQETAFRGVQFVMDARNPGKAWRYKPNSGDNDMSVSGWCVMALKTAEDAGLLEVPQSVWDGVSSHLDDVTDLSYGGVGYLEKGSVAMLKSEEGKCDPNDLPPSLTAVGVMCRIFMGQKRSDAAIANSAGILISDKNLPKWEPGKYGKIDYYYWFYGTYALNQFDGPKGPSWKKWESAIVPLLVRSQKTKQDGCADGSWDPVDRWSSEGSRVYTTAISVLTLEVYYRLRIAGKK